MTPPPSSRSKDLMITPRDYTLTIREDGELIDTTNILDPFITTTIKVCGLRGMFCVVGSAWSCASMAPARLSRTSCPVPIRRWLGMPRPDLQRSGDIVWLVLTHDSEPGSSHGGVFSTLERAKAACPRIMSWRGPDGTGQWYGYGPGVAFSREEVSIDPVKVDHHDD